MRLLEISGVSAAYGDLKVLHDVSLHVDEGEIVSLVGSNGAGKTMLLRIISGLVPVTEGQITLGGKNLLKVRPYERVSVGLSHIPQGRGTLAKLTVKENLILGAYSLKSSQQREENIERAYGMFPKLRERKNQIAGSLSGGEQQMLAIARALMCDPKIIAMDEPSLGLAPIVVENVFEIIQRVSSERKIAILIVEQNLVQSLSIAHRGYVLENGRIVREGEAKALLEDKDIRSAYLGI